MKWPFVRRSKYDHLTKCLDAKNDIIANQMDNIKSQFIEINRLNQELASDMNSHRETKKKLEETKDLWHKSLDHNDSFLNEIRRLEKELQETKEQKNELSAECDKLYDEVDKIKQHEQKLFEAHDKLNQQNMGLLFENEKLSKQNNQLILDKNHLKSKIKRLDSLLTKQKIELESAKNHVNWFYGNYARFKDMIEKSGYYKRV